MFGNCNRNCNFCAFSESRLLGSHPSELTEWREEENDKIIHTQMKMQFRNPRNHSKATLTIWIFSIQTMDDEKLFLRNWKRIISDSFASRRFAPNWSIGIHMFTFKQFIPENSRQYSIRLLIHFFFDFLTSVIKLLFSFAL